MRVENMKTISNYKKLCWLITIIGVFTSTYSFAQYKISGRLTNPENLGIESGNIRLLRSDSTFISGAISAESGHFQIDGIASGTYLLSISHIEYQKYSKEVTISQSDVLLGDIKMQPDSKVLNDVQVVADRIIKKKDGMLIFPQKNQLKFAGSGYDMLYNIMIPGVNVDRIKGTVTRLGQEVALYIDGQKASYREVQNMAINSIDRIEYIDVPSGKYIQDNTAINIITKKSEKGSYFAIDAKQNFGYRQGSYNGTAQFSQKQLTFHLFGGCDIADYDNAGSMISENYNLERGIVTRNSDVAKSIYKNNSQYVQANLKSTTPKSTLSAKVSFLRNITPDNGTIKKIEYINMDVENRESNELSDEKSYKPTIELSGDFKLPKKQNLSVTLAGSYNKNKYSHHYNEYDFANLTHADEDFYNTRLNLNYSKKIKNNTFSASLLESYRLSNSVYTGTSDYKQDLHTNEAILRIGYLHNFGKKWMLNSQLGASWLNYELKGEEQVNQIMPRANVMLRYAPFQKQAFTLSFNMGNSFPTINTLNTVNQAINSLLVKRGNPNLNMSKLYNTSLMYNLFSKKVSIQAMLIGNVFTNMAIPDYYTEGEKVVYSFNSNTDLYQCFGVLSGTYNVLKNFDVKTELAILHYQFKGELEKKHTTYRAMLDLNYSWKNFMFNIAVKAKEKRLTNSAVFEEDFTNYEGNVRWSVPNWLVEIGVANLFSGNNYLETNYSSKAYSYMEKQFDKTNQKNVYLKVIYRLNQGKKQKIEKSKMDRSINSAIMKVQ